MDFSVKPLKIAELESYKSPCIIIPVFENTKTLHPALAVLDKTSQYYISKILAKGDCTGKLNQFTLLHQVPNIAAVRILLVGSGKAEKALTPKEFITLVGNLSNYINNLNITSCLSFLCDLVIKDTTQERALLWKIRQSVISMLDASYTFDAFKSTATKTKKTVTLKNFDFVIAGDLKPEIIKTAKAAISTGLAIAQAKKLCRDLANTPANICTPQYLAGTAQGLARKYKKITVNILGKKAIQKLNMGALLAVAQGSILEPKLITLEYNGASKTKTKAAPIVLIGKGITFDTGGNSLKPPLDMVGMKYDMSGAASVISTIQAAAELNLPLNLIGIVPSAENMPGGTASRPNDIVTTMSGLTVEILNTDAEGRLILCEALSYATRFKPRAVIDIATLTGACIIALGRVHSGLFSNNDALASALTNAGDASLDKCWRLPLGDDYAQLLESKWADLANIGGPEAGSITAACFLARFAESYHWAHLDIAGSAVTGKDKQAAATGRPVGLLVQYLLDQCNYN